MPKKAKEVQAAQKEVTALTRAVDSGWLKVHKLKEGETHYLQATATLKEIKERRNAFKAKLRKITEPLNEVLTFVKAEAKPAFEQLEQLEKHIKRLVLDREEAERQKVLKAAEREAKRAEKKGAKQLATDIREHAQTARVSPSNSGVSTKRHVTWELDDFSKVPREYLEISRGKIAAAVRAGKKIPGITVVEKRIAVVK
jgi:chromosome segregation ATPase